jgi:hypothetical protein
MPTRITKASFTDAFDLRIKKQWMQGYGEAEHEFESIYNTVSMGDGEGSDKRYSYITTFPRWEQKDETTNTVPFETVYQGYDTTITPYLYWSAFTVGKETWRDDPSGLIGPNLATAHAQAARETIEYLAAVPFNVPTSATGFSPWMSGGDGVALLSESHPIVTGGVYANKPATDIDISIASLQASLLRLAKMQNARGLPYPMKGATLVFPADARFLVREILGTTQMPFSADNTINPIKGDLTPFEWSYLTDTDAWFVLANKAGGVSKKGHQMIFLNRQSPEFDRDNVLENSDKRFKGDFRLGFGYPDWRGVDGSTG